MLDVLKLSEEGIIGLFLITAEKAVSHFSQEEQQKGARIIAQTIIESSWTSLENSCSADHYYTDIAEKNLLKFAEMQEKASEDSDIEIYECLTNAIIYISGYLFIKEDRQLSQLLEMAIEPDMIYEEHAESFKDSYAGGEQFLTHLERLLMENHRSNQRETTNYSQLKKYSHQIDNIIS